MSESTETLFQGRILKDGKVTLDIIELRMYGENLRSMIRLTPTRAIEYIRQFEYHVLRNLAKCSKCQKTFQETLLLLGVCPNCMNTKYEFLEDR